ncbi:MAG: hypothetical protein MJZ66_08310 [Bacteroidales bacterium]|nr:hypothetical protein [Bacteroidales bacterium]
MKKIAHFVMLLMLAAMMQACETDLDTEIENPAMAIKGNYSLVRTYLLANDQVAIPLKTIILSDANLPVKMQSDSVVMVDGNIKCSNLVPLNNGVGFTVPNCMAYGIVTEGVDSINVKGRRFSGYYAAPTKTLQMWYYVKLSDYSTKLQNEVYPSISDAEWDTFLGYLKKIIMQVNAANGIYDDVTVTKSDVSILVPSMFNKVIFKDAMRMVSKQ